VLVTPSRRHPLIPIKADIANAVMFLFSPAASWINGSVMVRLSSPVLIVQLLEPTGIDQLI
jgi:NAD(P)-dependent dehydrogenase (short-subunit alcohol dehydrogenase family)